MPDRVGRTGDIELGLNEAPEPRSINTVGIILMVAGVVGLLLSLLFWSNFSPYRRRTTAYPEERVVEERRIERDYP